MCVQCWPQVTPRPVKLIVQWWGIPDSHCLLRVMIGLRLWQRHHLQHHSRPCRAICSRCYVVWMTAVTKEVSRSNAPFIGCDWGVLQNDNVKGPGNSYNDTFREQQRQESRSAEPLDIRMCNVVSAMLHRVAVDWRLASRSKWLEKSSQQRRRSSRKLCSVLIIWTCQWLRMTLDSSLLVVCQSVFSHVFRLSHGSGVAGPLAAWCGGQICRPIVLGFGKWITCLKPRVLVPKVACSIYSIVVSS